MNGATRSAVVIGGSAGSIEPLQRLIAALPPDLAASVFVVVHVPPDSVSSLPHIISRSGPLFATHAIDRAPIAPGRVFVAPPNYHLSVEDGVMRVLQGARENSSRPSIDVLFRSAAVLYRERVVGVLLSGTLDDGVAGLYEIRVAGGATMVQDPSDSLFPEMPRNAIQAGVVELVVESGNLGAAVTEFVRSIDERQPSGEIAGNDERDQGVPSVFTCPDCGGTLWELDTEATLRFRCRTGHAYSTDSMLASQTTTLEESLWTAIRSLQERQDMLRKIAARARVRGDFRTAERLTNQSIEIERDINKINASLDGLLHHQGSVS